MDDRALGLKSYLLFALANCTGTASIHLGSDAGTDDARGSDTADDGSTDGRDSEADGTMDGAPGDADDDSAVDADGNGETDGGTDSGDDGTIVDAGEDVADATADAGDDGDASADASDPAWPIAAPGVVQAVAAGCDRVRVVFLPVYGDPPVTYRLVRDGVVIGTLAASGELDTGLSASTSYDYAVEAFDGTSAHRSAERTVTTPACSPDSTPPPAPVVTATTACRIAYPSWTHGVDTATLLGYRVYRNGLLVWPWSGDTHAPVSQFPNTQVFSDFNWVSADTDYTYRISAVDLAGNESDLSDPLAVHTPECVGSYDRAWTGELRTVVLVARFSDDPVTTTTAAHDLIFNQYDDFLRENSYGRTWLSGSTYLSELADTYESYLASDGHLEKTRLTTDIAALVDDEINFNEVDMVVFVTPNQALAYYWSLDFTNADNGTSATLPRVLLGSNHMTLSAVAKHLGREMGLRIQTGSVSCTDADVGASLWDVSLGCDLRSSSGGLDPLGRSSDAPHYSAYQKERMGFLLPEESVWANEPDQTLTLTPLETTASGLKGIKIPLGADIFYWIEYRRPSGYDSVLGVDGVVVHLHRAFPLSGLGTETEMLVINSAPNVALPLSPTVPFIDPYRAVRIDVLSLTASVAQVRILRGE